MYSFRRLLYYLRSIATLLLGVRNPGALVALAVGKGPVLLRLRDGSQYEAGTLMDAWIIKETALDRDYEKNGVPLRDGWMVIDIGAAAGEFTIFAARRVPNGRVLAFEPAPDSVATLRRNVELNGLTNVEVHGVAVGARDGKVQLDISGGVAVQYRTAGTGGGGKRVEVPCVALGKVLAGLPGGRVDLLKIDTEGAEYELLYSLDPAALRRIGRICMEYHEGVTPYSHGDLERFFIERGWSVRTSPSRVRKELGFLYAEALGE